MMRGKRWVCLALCLLTLLGTVQVSAAAIIALRPTFVDITGDDCRVYEQSADIGTLSYSAMAAPDSLSSAGIGQEAVMEGGVQTGTMVTLTMNSSQKAQLRLAVFSTKLWVPAHTKYTVKHSFTVSGGCDTASFQLVSLGTSCRLSGATLSPFIRDTESEKITGGLSTGTALAQGLQQDGDVITAEHTYPYENTTDTGKYISQYFALWAAARHDDTGRGQAAVTCTLTTKAVQTTAEVTLLKDDQPWTGQTVGVSCGAGADDYRFTETADGVYTYSGSGGDAIFPLDGTKFSIYLKGDALKVYDTMAYPTDAQDGPYQKAIDYYTITYSTGDAICISPRSQASSSYSQLTLIDAESGAMRESLTLPASMRPLEAAYVNGRFSFTFDSIYTYGEGLASLGTYAPVSNDTGGQWFCFDRNPLCAPAWCGGNLIVKSTRTVAGVNLSTREMFSLDCPDDCDNYGDFLASQGDVGSLVTYLGMSTNEDDAYTLVRVWTA